VCGTCPCGQPENKHGDERNITVSEFLAASYETKVAPGSAQQALRNMKRAIRIAAMESEHLDRDREKLVREEGTVRGDPYE
jgi:hypothetical protein